MSRGAPTAERLALGSILLGLPALFIFLVLLPDLRAMKSLKEELESARVRLEALPAAAPLGEDEKRLLDDPTAPWKERIPAVSGDAARLAHYHRVVTGLHGTWRHAGLAPCTIRSSWDPIRASFSLPNSLGTEGTDPRATPLAGRGRVLAWVVEVRLDGPPEDLFKALRGLPEAGPLLEPVGLRWEHGRETSQQSLLLRNYVLGP